MSRKSNIVLCLFGSAFVIWKLFSTPFATESFYILLVLLILYLSAAVYHFIKRKEPSKLFQYPPQVYFFIGAIVVISAIVLLAF